MLTKLYADETGIVISAELILIATIVFCSSAVGFAAIGSAVVHELDDISDAVGATSQSYNVVGIRKAKDTGKPHASCSGFGFNDHEDDCDCRGVVQRTTCGKTQTNSGTSGRGEDGSR